MWIRTAPGVALLLLVGATQAADRPLTACRACCNSDGTCSTRATGDVRAESRNFIVRSYSDGPVATDAACRCETQRRALGHDWLAIDPATEWRPKCEVVLHRSRQSYLQAVGPSGQQTVGSAMVTVRARQVTRRRIDLLVLADAGRNIDQALSGLPHELVHVLLADLFPTTAPPRWAEEGLALLADPPDKQARHARDLEAALRANSTFPLAHLVSGTEYPTASRWGVYYAQSMSLVDYLTQLDTPETFVRFVQLSAEIGPDRALRREYGINGLAELEVTWNRYALESVRQIVMSN